MKVGVLATMVFASLIAYPIASFAGLAPDADNDGIPDVLDKCSADSRNAVSTCDTDVDGYGNVCDGDFDQGNAINATDFTNFFVPAFKGFVAPTRGQDMDCGGTVNATDFTNYFIPRFKSSPSVPGPSGLSCAGTAGCM
jgi:hypothetical protein